VDLVDLGFFNLIWELYVEFDEQVSILVRSFMERHTQIFTGHYVIWFDYLTCWVCDSNNSPVQVHYCEVDSGQSLEKCYFFVQE